MSEPEEYVVCNGDALKRALNAIADLENEVQELKEANKQLENQLMMWKNAALIPAKSGQRFKLTQDPYSPIGMRIEPVVE